jgi:hypothetical protein
LTDQGRPRTAAQGVWPLWKDGGLATNITAQHEPSPASRAALPVTGSATVGFFHEVVPGSLAVFAGAGANVGNSPVNAFYRATPIGAPSRLQRAAVGTLGPVVSVEARVTPRNWPVVGRVDATAYLPVTSVSALDFAGDQARGRRIDVGTGPQAQVGLTVSSRDIAVGGMRLTPFMRAEMPIAGAGEPTVYAGFELGRSRKGPNQKPSIEMPSPLPDAATPMPTAAATVRPPALAVSPPTKSNAQWSSQTGAAALGGPITLTLEGA